MQFGSIDRRSLEHGIYTQWTALLQAGARACNRGSIYAADGNLVASVAQEGLVRQPGR